MHDIDLSDRSTDALPAPAPAAPPSTGDFPAWAPFRFASFRRLWSAALAGYLFNWMQQVGAATLMTGLTPSPMMVALVQTAASVPSVVLGLPAGALADLIDRRRWLVFTQAWILLAAALCCAVIGSGALGPGMLLALTALLGAGFALQSPAVQALMGESVPLEVVPAALSLGGVGFNLSRIVGPALAGAIAGLAGGSGIYAVIVLGSAVVMVVYLRQPAAPSRPVRPRERLWTALRGGLSHMRHTPVCRAGLIHTFVFMGCGSATWALLPVLARSTYHLGAGGYGLLLGALGAGGIAGAVIYPAVHARRSPHALVGDASVGFGLVTAALALRLPQPVVIAALVAGGVFWSFGATSIYASLQLSLPDHVRARGVSLYGVVYFIAMAGGAAFWGGLATLAGTPVALELAAAASALSAFGLRRAHLVSVEPSHH